MRKKAPVYPMTPNAPRSINAILFLVLEAEKRNKKLTQYDIVKSIFLSDRAHLNKYGRPITFDNYVAMPHGPVPSFSYNVLKENSAAFAQSGLKKFPWKRTVSDYSSKVFHYHSPVGEPDSDILSESDIETLSESLTIVLALGFQQIKKLTHEDQAYLDAWEDDGGQRSYPMSYTLLFDQPNDDLAKELAFISKHL